MKNKFYYFLLLSLWIMTSTNTLYAQAGAALNFDGVNDYVYVTSPLNLNSNTASFEAWVKPATTVEPNSMIIGNRTDATPAGIIFTTTNRQIGYIWNNNYYSWAGGPVLAANTWSHVALVVEPTQATMYVNGTPYVSTGTHNAQAWSGAFAIGMDPRFDWGDRHFAGAIDEVRVWNRVLTQCDVQNNMNCELNVASQTGLVAYYKFNQGTNNANNSGVTTLTDASGNNRHGTLNYFNLTGTTSNWISGGGVTTGTTCTALTPTVSIAASPSNIISTGTSVTFTATPTNGGTTPQYQWKKNNGNVGSNSATYTNAALANNDIITCVMTSNAACVSSTTATSNSITMTVNPPGAALNFDGSNDNISLGTTLGNFGTSDFTIETYFKTASASIQHLITKRPTCGHESFWGLTMNAGKIYIEVDQNTSATNYYNRSTPNAYNDNNWHHVAAVRAGASLKLYVDGVLVASGSGAGTASLSNSTTLYIGSPNACSGSASYFNGSMDEIRIWNRALPECEIQNNRSCELGSGQTNLLAYYKFNQGVSSVTNTGITSLTDASGNANTGTLNNFALTGATSNWIATGGVTTGTTCTAYAPYYTWTGATSTNWATTTNWSCGVVPTNTSNVTIPTTTNQPALSANQTITNLTLSGTNKIILGSSNLTVNSITGGSSTAYIVTDGIGALTIKTLATSTSTIFPIGVSTTSYDPLSIKPTNSVDFTAKVKATTVAGDFTGTIANLTKVAKRQWDITPTGSAGSTVLTLTNGGTTYTPTTAKVGHYTSSNVWEELAATYNVGTWTATTTSFSPFGVGDAGGFFSVLSVELLDFKATPSVSGNLLTWTTANEVNNKGFNVESLMDNGQWASLGFVNAKGKAATYDFVDNSPLSTNYYRLRQIDNNGKETLSKVVSVSRNPSTKLKVYPNPVFNVLTVETAFVNARDEANFQILNLLGQQVLTGKTPPSGVGGLDVSALPQGAYFLKVGAEQVKFIKE